MHRAPANHSADSPALLGGGVAAASGAFGSRGATPGLFWVEGDAMAAKAQFSGVSGSSIT